jgi:hypothetical protein
MPLSELYMRVVPSKMPKVGDQKMIPTGPAQATAGTITAVDPEGVILLKLVSGVMLCGYCAKQKPGFDVHRMTERGIAANPNEEMWIFNTVEPRR